MDNKKSGMRWSYIVVVAIFAILIALMFINPGSPGTQITESNAITLIENGEVEEIYFKDNLCKIKLVAAPGREEVVDFPKNADHYVSCTDQGRVLIINSVVEYNNAGPTVKIEWRMEESYPVENIIFPVLFVCIGAVAIFLIFKVMSSGNKSAANFGRSRARQTSNIKVRFSDIAGADEEKAELAEIVEFLKTPEKFRALGARIPKGILLVGPPGTGKTLLARAVAGESNVPFLSISGSDFVEMFVGVGASRVRDLFLQAKKSMPCIVFIDEIDAVGRQRGAGLGGGNDEREQTLNQLLVEMDGFEANDGIIVLAATNRSDVLDPALTRPGRFDRQIRVYMPDVKGREGIIKIHARNKPIAESVNFNTLARITSGFTGADLENMLNEAAILAARAGRPRILMTDITEGINKVIMGPQKKSRIIPEKEKKNTAYHEAGHAVLAVKLKHCDPVQEVSIIPRGNAAGYTLSRPIDDDNSYTYNKLMDAITMMMGGRIAEDMIMKDVTAGASSDIRQATEIARRMVTEWGMSKKLGFMNFGSSEAVFVGRDYQVKSNISEKTAAEIDDEIRALLESNYKRAKEILSKNVKLMDEMVKLLLEKETIYKEEVDMLLDGKKTSDIIKEMDIREQKRLEEEQKERKEMERAKLIAEYQSKVETGAVFEQNGIITSQEFQKIKDEYAAVVKEASKEEKPVAKGKTVSAKEPKKAKGTVTKKRSPKKDSVKKESKPKTTKKPKE